MVEFVEFSLFKWLFANEPAETNIFSLKTKHSNLRLAVSKTVTNKADELHVVEVNDLLRLLFVRQVYHDHLTVVRNKTLVDHERIVNLDILG